MHIDARELENNSTIEGDICIIGAGAAGIAFALEWLNRKEKVILLEGGGFEYEDAMQDLYIGKTTGQRYFPLRSTRLHFFGGTTNHWAGYCAQFDAIDFQRRSWVPHSGWPITLEDIRPYYSRVQTVFDLGPEEYEVSQWKEMDSAMTPLPLNHEVVWSKIWQFSPPTRFGEKYKDTIVSASNIHLYTHANVTDISANEHVNRIESVTVRNHQGKSHTVRARHFVVACCAIQNARLLLSSRHQAPNGLGNDFDNVGRYFMEHLEIKCSELWLSKQDSMKLYNIDFGTTRARAELAIHERQQQAHEILNGTASFEPLAMARNQPSFMELWTDDQAKNEQVMHNFGSSKAELKVPAGYEAYQLFTRIEQAPNPNSRVTIDSELDALGVPRANLHWELSSLEKRSLRKIHELIGQEVGRSAIGRLQLLDYLKDETDPAWPSFTGGGWHNMGTTRMSDSPKQGVVDKDCKVFGINNLFMAGSSCFVTAGAVNPTLTLVALTVRLSDHIKQLMRA